VELLQRSDRAVNPERISVDDDSALLGKDIASEAMSGNRDEPSASVDIRGLTRHPVMSDKDNMTDERTSADPSESLTTRVTSTAAEAPSEYSAPETSNESLAKDVSNSPNHIVNSNSESRTAPTESRSATQVPQGQDPGLRLAGGVDTNLGGVLFLINLMCALDLPEAFEPEWQLQSTYGSWGVLDALARGLMASRADAAEDPMWTALEALSGARQKAGGTSTADYRLPDTWLAQLPPTDRVPAAWAVRRGRFRLWTHAGCVLRDARLGESDPAEEARSEALRYGGVGPLIRAPFFPTPVRGSVGSLTASLDPTLRRWVALVIPFMLLRLAHALGIDPDDDNLDRVLLARAGRLFVTSTHVDLVMGLDGVSLPVRMAGLDRSPGWLNTFGRVILFHYE
jgi:hypothetical protein